MNDSVGDEPRSDDVPADVQPTDHPERSSDGTDDDPGPSGERVDRYQPL